MGGDLLYKEKIGMIAKVGIFILIGIILFGFFQNILARNWDDWKGFAENSAASFKTFYGQEKDIDQVLFLGTSHSEYAVSPMEIYEDSGIVSYNISTSIQPIEASYYLLQSAFSRQSPEVVVMDVSNLFFEDELEEKGWRYIFDSMPLSASKIRMARRYVMLKNDTDQFNLSCEKDFLNVLVPMFQYHTRWSELSQIDFEDVMKESYYIPAGYVMQTTLKGSSVSVEEMNDIAALLESSDPAYEKSYNEKGSHSYELEDSLYTVDITDQKLLYLQLIQELCESNGAQLVLAKYPVVVSPVEYSSAWTMERSDYTKALADSFGLDFLDFVYDIDCGFDYALDFCDGGKHSNYTGAKKISLYMSDYLQKNFGLESKVYEEYEANKEKYDRLAELAELQLSIDCSDIMDYLLDHKEQYIICIAAQGDMSSSLAEEEIEAFQALGLQTDFKEDMAYADSYIAVINRGKVLVEKESNRQVWYKGEINDLEGEELVLNIGSSGNLTWPYASICINGQDYSIHGAGINIVLIDKDTQTVVASKAINTSQKNADHFVTSGDNFTMFEDYWEELIK
jgi:hypothetical protein